MSAQLQWSGDEQVQRKLRQYQGRAEQVLRQVGQYWAASFERDAKTNARWTDRTGNARQALHGYLAGEAPSMFSAPDSVPYPDESPQPERVVVYLSHGMRYGQHLEAMEAYAIIMDTLEANLPEIRRMLDGIFR